ncbi:preprotein translocase subunit SecE [Galactobacter valiniphilus]|uniref:Protein translocase subunit SecE n=1 Tax=Galactobacter valiniphilus TaxID=2676122 RepID=A0A399JCU2_9MICC|nr:preprotein translocase subunit SecE [Galactobacter valiniphilus]RII43373.1 preprotein translocase subunit SecE [Galactobacter valiniphilus]
MTDTTVKGSGASKKKRGFFSAIGLFLAQVVQELKKVVSPTRRELVNYWLVVLAFVVIVMIVVGLLDTLFGQLSMWTFTRPAEQ